MVFRASARNTILQQRKVPLFGGQVVDSRRRTQWGLNGRKGTSPPECCCGQTDLLHLALAFEHLLNKEDAAINAASFQWTLS